MYRSDLSASCAAAVVVSAPAGSLPSHAEVPARARAAGAPPRRSVVSLTSTRAMPRLRALRLSWIGLVGR